jgi:hypothetical protein
MRWKRYVLREALPPKQKLTRGSSFKYFTRPTPLASTSSPKTGSRRYKNPMKDGN